MSLRVSLHNLGGELDHRIVRQIGLSVSAEEAAAKAAIEMIQEAGELHPGDKIIVSVA